MSDPTQNIPIPPIPPVNQSGGNFVAPQIPSIPIGSTGISSPPQSPNIPTPPVAPVRPISIPPIPTPPSSPIAPVGYGNKPNIPPAPIAPPRPISMPSIPTPPLAPSIPIQPNIPAPSKTIDIQSGIQSNGKVQPSFIPAPMPIGNSNEQIENNILMENILNDDLTEDKKKKKLSVRIIQLIISFEEKHPWVFFFFTAIIIFFIIVSLLSLFIGNGDKVDINNTNTPEMNSEEREFIFEPTVEDDNKEVIEETNENKTEEEENIVNNNPLEISGSLQAITLQKTLIEKKSFDSLIYKNSGESYLGEYFTHAKTLEAILNVDIQNELDSSSNRKTILTRYLLDLKKSSEQVSQDSAMIESIINTLSTEQKSLKKLTAQQQKDIEEVFVNSGVNELLELNDNYKKNLDRLSKIESEISIANILIKIYKKRLPFAEARLTAIRQNYEALVQDITIKPVNNSGIDFTRPSAVQLEQLQKEDQVVEQKNSVENMSAKESNAAYSPITEEAIDKILNKSEFMRLKH